MITEAQRRALFALREALHLCDGARVAVRATTSPFQGDEYQQEIQVGNDFHYTCEEFLSTENIDAILSEHPE